MTTPSFSLPFILILSSYSWVLLISQSQSLTCTTQTFTNKNTVYSHCLDLPSLSSYLHFTYDSSNTTLSIAFIATAPSSAGWVSWAINPTSTGMAGCQSLVAYNHNGKVNVKLYNVSSYTSIVEVDKLGFDVWDLQGEEDGSSGSFKIFAKIKVPADLAEKKLINHVWQIGPGVSSDGMLVKHEFNPENLKAVGTLDLVSGEVSSSGGAADVDSKLKKKNIHGILNTVSWGLLFPLGVVIARYVRTFKSADPAWFYLHVTCQLSAYVLGVAGWGTGLKLGSESKGIVYTGHRNIGISLFCLATVQIFALFLRPNKDHKFRLYWNIYHHGLGYAVIILGIINVFKGFDILRPEEKWKSAYIIVIAILGGIAVLLEAITWIVVLRRKSDKSTKPFDGHTNGDSRQQPLTI